MENVRNRACNKSIKGIPIKYKGEVILLDPVKVGIATFGLTASLVIAGVTVYNAPRIVQTVGQEMAEAGQNLVVYGEKLEAERETSYLKVLQYYKNINRKWEEANYFISKNDGIIYPEYALISQDIYSDKDLMDIKISAYMREFHENSKPLFKNLAELEGLEYENLNEYVKAKGYENVSDFMQNCDKLVKEILENEYKRKNELESQSKEETITFVEEQPDNLKEWFTEILEAENPDDKIYEFYQYCDLNEEKFNDFISKYAYAIGKDYTDIDGYLQDIGFSSKSEWVEYQFQKTMDEAKRGR